MKQTKSFQNIKNKKKGNNKNLELFNALSLRLRDFESANTKTSGFSSSTKNIINNHKRNYYQHTMQKGKNNSYKEKKDFHYSSPNEKDNNLINIRLNIKSEIINNNFSGNKNENNDNLNKEFNEVIKQKNNIINSLEKELSEVKEKIKKIQTKRKRLNSVDNIEKHNSYKRKKNSNHLRKDFNEIFKIHNLKPSNIISKNVKQFFKTLMLKKESEIKGNNGLKKNLILNTSNYNNYIKHNHKNNLLTKNLYSNPTREIEIVEMEKNNLLTQTRKNSASMFKSNSFLFTSQNSNSNKRKHLENNRRCQSQFDTYNYNNNYYYNNDNNNLENYENENIENENNIIRWNNENINHNSHNKNNESDIFNKLNKLKSRTQYLLNNFLSFCDDK